MVSILSLYLAARTQTVQVNTAAETPAASVAFPVVLLHPSVQQCHLSTYHHHLQTVNNKMSLTVCQKNYKQLITRVKFMTSSVKPFKGTEYENKTVSNRNQQKQARQNERKSVASAQEHITQDFMSKSESPEGNKNVYKAIK